MAYVKKLKRTNKVLHKKTKKHYFSPKKSKKKTRKFLKSKRKFLKSKRKTKRKITQKRLGKKNILIGGVGGYGLGKTSAMFLGLGTVADQLNVNARRPSRNEKDEFIREVSQLKHKHLSQEIPFESEDGQLITNKCEKRFKNMPECIGWRAAQEVDPQRKQSLARAAHIAARMVRMAANPDMNLDKAKRELDEYITEAEADGCNWQNEQCPEAWHRVAKRRDAASPILDQWPAPGTETDAGYKAPTTAPPPPPLPPPLSLQDSLIQQQAKMNADARVAAEAAVAAAPEGAATEGAATDDGLVEALMSPDREFGPADLTRGPDPREPGHHADPVKGEYWGLPT